MATATLVQHCGTIVPDHKPVFVCNDRVSKACTLALHKARNEGYSLVCETKTDNAGSPLFYEIFL